MWQRKITEGERAGMTGRKSEKYCNYGEFHKNKKGITKKRKEFVNESEELYTKSFFLKSCRFFLLKNGKLE